MRNKTMRLTIWWLINFGFIVVTITTSIISGAPEPRLLYLALLFSLCSSPIFYAEALNERYFILMAILALYFLFYGLSDLLALMAAVNTGETGILSVTEAAILLGGSVMVGGYRLVAHKQIAAPVTRDWAPRTLLVVGLLCWALGAMATLYWQVRIIKKAFHMEIASATVGAIVILGMMIQPVGTALLSYRLVKYRGTSMLVFMIFLVVTELVIGVISDSKEIAIRGLVILLVTKLLVDGKIPKSGFVAAGVAIILMFPVFQAYRYEVLDVRKQAREQAAQNFIENISTAIRSVTDPGAFGSRGGTGLIDRISMKPNMRIIMDRVGNTAKFQNGYTYGLFFKGFIPRVLWPEKPDSSTGQLFNRELKISNFRDVYISVSFLGESYWNFGWTGIAVGMFLFGALLGLIGARFSLADGATVTRYLVLLITLYSFGLRIEGNVALQALIWVRSLAMVWLLHILFAKLSASPEINDHQVETKIEVSEAGAKFQNIMS